MKVTLNNISKRYKKDWIFKNISLEVNPSDSYAILGANGSGKSTLLKIIAGALQPTEGNITYSHDKINLSSASDEIYKIISLAAPYMELIEDYTLVEHINFHSHFKPFFRNISLTDVPEIIELRKAADRQVKYFSSGMKQRLRLGLAILSDTPLLLLDEPCSNLDQKGIDWYNSLILQHTKNRTLFICSNHLKHEYSCCRNEFTLGST